MDPDWYTENIEAGVRDVVRHLRENGVNTESSCHHEGPMLIQCQYIRDGAFKRVHDLLWNYLADHGRGVNFSIDVHHEVINGCSYTSMKVRIPKPNAGAGES